MLLPISAVTTQLRDRLGGPACRSTVLKWVTSGRLAGVKVVGKWHVAQSDLDAFVTSIRGAA